MMYTSHGYHIPGTPQAEPPPPREDCGGPGYCGPCSTDFHNSPRVVAVEKETVPMQTKTYTRKPFDVEAVQVTEENMDEVAAWTEGDIQTHEPNRPFISVDVTRPLNDRQKKAYVGDWVLSSDSGFKVYTNRAFLRTFELKTVEVLDGGVVGEA